MTKSWPHTRDCALSLCVYDYAPNDCCDCTCKEICRECKSEVFIRQLPDPNDDICRWCKMRETAEVAHD